MTRESRTKLAGRVAIVTGGAKGIGRHYSFALAAEGVRVMIADVAESDDVVREIAAANGVNSVASRIADVSDEASVKMLVEATLQRFGRIDILVNNAALFAPLQEQKCTEIEAELWDKVMAFTRALARELGEHGIRVNTLAPGFTLSDTVLAENPGHVQTARDRAFASRSLRRDETPQDLLGALVFLAGPESDFVTGQTLAVDGGNVNT